LNVDLSHIDVNKLNFIPVNLKLNDLHSLWDTNMGLLTDDHPNRDNVVSYATMLQEKYPISSYENIDITNPLSWNHDMKVYQDFVYQPFKDNGYNNNFSVDEEYMNKS